MSQGNAEPVIIPARLTAQALADAIGRPFFEVHSVLASRDEPDSPEDIVDHVLATRVAKALGRRVQVEARDLALEYLYELETRGELPDLAEGRGGDLARGVAESLALLDKKIEAASEHWSVARMPAIDRNILRLGLFELESYPETSTGVILSEAVRLAQAYSTEKSGPFVNGVLAALARDIQGR